MVEESDPMTSVARVIVAVRVAVVASIAVLVAIGPSWVRQHVGPVIVVVVLAAVYSLFMLWKPELEFRRAKYTWVVTVADASFTGFLIVMTGGLNSPLVTILVLVVVVAAFRLSALAALIIGAATAVAYAVIVQLSAGSGDGRLDRHVQAVWWPLYLVFDAVLATALVAAAEREQRSRLLASVEAEAEHAAAEEERDLRARLLQSYQSQQDGLRVLLHEFRTPLVSLDALGDALVDQSTPMSASDRAVSLRLAHEHVRHLNEMLDALGDVALSWRPTFSSGRVRTVDMEELTLAAADAVGLRPPRLVVSMPTEAHDVQVDAQLLRRVLTNLLENASRHGRDEPVEVIGAVRDGHLYISVSDRGPGVPKESLGELTAKYVSLGDQRGTAGLGLWIVQQIVEATGGRLRFSEREGGGLTATFEIPVNS